MDIRAANTLGGLLYAGPLCTPVSEEEWVELVRCIAARDQHALHELYRRLYGIVFTLLIRITKQHAMTEELTLDVFHDIWTKASTYDPEKTSVTGWIMNLARARALARLEISELRGVR